MPLLRRYPCFVGLVLLFCMGRCVWGEGVVDNGDDDVAAFFLGSREREPERKKEQTNKKGDFFLVFLEHLLVLHPRKKEKRNERKG